MFVHHEDVRRAHDGWEPRVLPDERQDALWGIARKVGKLGYRHAAVTVVFERPSGEQATVRKAGPAGWSCGVNRPNCSARFRPQTRCGSRADGEAGRHRAVTSLDRGF